MSKLSSNYNPFVIIEKAKTKHKIGVIKIKLEKNDTKKPDKPD